MTTTSDETKLMPEEWKTFSIRVKKDYKWPNHGTDIEFNGCRYIRADLATPNSEAVGNKEIKHAVGLAQWVYCSPHEWPQGEDVAKVCHALLETNEQLHKLKEAFGMFLNGMAYYETFPDNEEDAASLQKSATYNFLRARSHINEELASLCSDCCKAVYMNDPETKAQIERLQRLLEKENG